MPAPAKPTQSEHTLARIIKTLGLPQDAFTNPTMLAEMEMRDEMLRLWFALDSTEARQAVLNVARTLVNGRRS